MTERNDGKEKHVYLSERTENWSTWLDIGTVAIVIGIALFCAAFSLDGFWIGLCDVLSKN